jgi:hypothetical protein
MTRRQQLAALAAFDHLQDLINDLGMEEGE